MTDQPNQPDPIDIDVARALEALRSAEPPTGMEARILQTLEANRVAHSRAAASRVSGGAFVLMRSTFFRGALTGALVATAAACMAIFFAFHALHPAASPETAVTHVQQQVIATPVALNTGAPCQEAHERDEISARGPHAVPTWTGNPPIDAHRVPHPGSAWVGSEATTSRGPHLIPASFAPSHPAPPAPPTAQELALIQFVHTATPAQLAALNRPADGRSEAEREAAFNKFFGPSPEVLAIDEAQKKALGITDDEPAAPKTSKEGQL